jgi:hypothetical protein
MTAATTAWAISTTTGLGNSTTTTRVAANHSARPPCQPLLTRWSGRSVGGGPNPNGPRWVRMTPATSGSRRARAVTRGRLNPQVSARSGAGLHGRRSPTLGSNPQPPLTRLHGVSARGRLLVPDGRPRLRGPGQLHLRDCASGETFPFTTPEESGEAESRQCWPCSRRRSPRNTPTWSRWPSSSASRATTTRSSSRSGCTSSWTASTNSGPNGGRRPADGAG